MTGTVRPSTRLPATAALAFLLLGVAAPSGRAQDAHIMAPTDSVEHQLRHGTFDVLDQRGSRFEGDRTSRAVLSFPDGTLMAVKWAPAPRGGEEFNNVPRYEVAAYELQKLFLDEPDFVVPPTVLRTFPLAWYRHLVPDAGPTFRGTGAVLVTLQYWLFNVGNGTLWDEARFAADPTYARHVGNFNVLTYLVHHSDANDGNYLVSRTTETPRIFSVDNGVAFASETSDRGTDWRRMRVPAIPVETAARLQALTEDHVTAALETLAQYRIGPDGQLVEEAPGQNLGRHQGIRRRGDVLQIGLTRSEIGSVWRRIERLRRQLDRGEIGTTGELVSSVDDGGESR